jgi:hypothetical protein
MKEEKFTCYWIGQEPTGPGKSPPLNQMPACVDVACLAFVSITEDDQLDFDFLTQQNSAAIIKGWIKELRARDIKVLLSINSQRFATIKYPAAFAQTVKKSVDEWQVDGVDIDYEPPSKSPTVIEVTKQLRTTLKDALLIAPIYGAWLGMPEFLGEFAAYLDYLTTMDYTPYPGFEGTIECYGQYANAIGGPGKLAIGVSCMEPPSNFTPLDDVTRLCQWEPENGHKQGMMLYTYSYDIKSRPGGGTGYPDGTWTKTICENLP